MLSLRQSMNILRPYFKLQAEYDFDKPNFIFTSDIHKTIINIVSKYLLIGENGGELTDMTQFYHPMLEFNVNIELNTLLARNRDLMPSDLIKENLITLAKTKDRCSTNIESLLTTVPKTQPLNINPYQFMSNEVFIVNLTLKVLDFIICTKENTDVIIDFLKDENYGILILSDQQLVDQIENYIKATFIKELKEQQTLDPRVESREINIADNSYLADITDVPMGIQDDSINNGKSFIYDDDYESSFEELLLLRSNDTRSTANEEGNDEYEIKTQSILMENDDENNVFRNNGPSISKTNKQINTIKEEECEDTFIEDINNLRHNEYFIRSDNLQESTKNARAIPESTPVHSETQNKHKQNTSLLKSPAQLTEQNLESPKSTTRRLSVISLSPKHKSVSRRTSTASFSMINYEDTNPDLEYAFRDKSSTVPTYIKLDKKFKFIKVGKVQKFVNLFEEKLDLASNSTPSTRATSPLKKAYMPTD
mmetsp:Transcript_8051/g.9909  ORF Transcript_8051/g.9909 Transcript_8051/m.9909 type:complete len:481 (+) Transcript_8051:60-1502(+)